MDATNRSMQAFPAATPATELEIDDDTHVDLLPPACACVACDEQHRANALLERLKATNVTTVRTPHTTPEFKAYVTLEPGPKGQQRSGRGDGHSESQAVFEALRSLGVG